MPTKAQYRRLRLTEIDNLELLVAHEYAEEFPLHFHETFCVSLIERGVFDENGLLATKGSICITPPNLVHDNKLVTDTGYSFTTFYVPPDFFAHLNGGAAVFFSETIIEDQLLFGELKAAANRIVDGKKTPNLSAELMAVFRRMVAQFGGPVAENAPSPAAVKIMSDLHFFIENNLHGKLELDNIARIAGMDRFKFVRFFKKNRGLSPFSYITLRRLEHAKTHLKNGLPIVHAALDAGFYDQAHFSKYFKHYNGITPFDYLRGCNILQD